MAIYKSSVSGIPSGNTSSRPSSPVIGNTYYNGQLGQLEIYNGTDWVAVSAPPLAPTIATPTDASSGDAYSSTGGKLSVVFTKNSNGGEPIQYNAYTTSGGFSASSSTSTVTLTGLTPGTSYTVYGTVSNNFGTSTNSSNATAVAPSVLAQAPTIGTLAANNTSGQLTLTFTAGNSGGKSISNYKYSTNGTTYTAFSPAQTTSPLTISGLTDGTSYQVYLKAVTANGDSAASAQSNAATPVATFPVDYLVVAGGGGAGGDLGAAGGAGGLRSTITATGRGGSLETALSISKSTNYTVTVGAGGAGDTNSADGTNGSNSVFSTITSSGGGGGAGDTTKIGKNGGCGGGGQGYAAGAGTTNQGYGGGLGVTGSAGGGGGGAGSAGLSGSSNTGGYGGSGVAVSITGSSVTYAGGGGGGGSYARGGGPGFGGSGGGGYGSGATGAGGEAGGTNLGGGGGGGSISGGDGAAGGSGVVILRWLTSDGTITVGAGLTADSTGTDGSYSYKRFTAGSGNVSWS